MPQIENVTQVNCVRKYHLIEGSHSKGRFNVAAAPTNTSQWPIFYSNGSHALFIGEDNALMNNNNPNVVLNGRGRPV